MWAVAQEVEEIREPGFRESAGAGYQGQRFTPSENNVKTPRNLPSV